MNIHIGEKIKARTKELKIGSTEFGKLINTTKQNSYAIFKRQTIDAQLLYVISKALSFNFFQYYNTPELTKFDPNFKKDLDDLRKENQKLKSDITSLKEKYELLEKINKLLEQKNKPDPPSKKK